MTSRCRSKNPANCRYHGIGAYSKPQKVVRHGVEVVKGKIAVSNFARSFNQRKGENSYYEGSWTNLVSLVKQYWKDQEPGTGSVNGDVVLVNVPPAGFYTPIVEVTPENQHLVEEKEVIRQEGEKPVTMKMMKGKKPPAEHVQIVVYRADVLAQDNDRSSDAEWEIIAIKAQIDRVTPMHPTTMLRNANHDEGGTLREYSQEEWDAAYSYWASHAYIVED
jgi:hypothetical protein